METTLHRQLKEHYADSDSVVEAKVGRFRIDIRHQDRLIEVQHSGLSSIREKTKVLLKNYDVEVIKPIIARKRLIKLQAKDGPMAGQRWSPKQGSHLDLFHELVYFASVFPHRRLTLRIPLVEIEEWRFPFRRRWHRGQFKVQDQKLLGIVSEEVYRKAADLKALLPADLPRTFDTKQLAEALGIERWFAQRIAYCLRETGCARVSGKRGNSFLYVMSPRNRAKPGKRRKIRAA